MSDIGDASEGQNKPHKGSICHLVKCYSWLQPAYPVSQLNTLPARSWISRSIHLTGHIHTWLAEFP